MTLQYSFTNESLDAVMHGMQLSRENNALAVLGAGCQAFAMLEQAGSVIAVDNNPVQVKFALERKAMLEAGDFKGFLEHRVGTGIEDGDFADILKAGRDAYFTPERMESIRRNLDKLEIREGNIFQQEGKFSGIYLSNVLRYTPKIEAKQGIRKLAGLLENNGLLYIADKLDIWAINDSDPAYDIHKEGLKMEKALSTKASELSWHSIWFPAIYRKP